MILPTTLNGWVLVISLMGGILAASVRVTFTMIRDHIDRRIDVKLSDTVQAAVVLGMAPVALQLRTMNGEIGRIRVLEQKLENGIVERQERLETKLDSIVEHLLWDGSTERRT